MRVARLISPNVYPAHDAPLVLAAHGSRDPRFAEVIDSIAAQVRARLAQSGRADRDVQVAYLDHGPPLLPDLDTAGAVVVPVFLARGFHVVIDVPVQAADDAFVARAIGPDPLLAVAVRDRLAEAGYDGKTPVVLAAAGSKSNDALADVKAAADQLADLIGVRVKPAFVSDGSPLLSKLDVSKNVVASYLLSPGVFADDVAACGAALVSAPIGAHPAIAQIVVNRYDVMTTW